MFDNINELIEINLKLLNQSSTKSLWRMDFRDDKGFELNNSEKFADIMQERGLINFEPAQRFRCDLTELGREIFKHGGWLKKLELDGKSKEAELKKAELKDTLEIELKTLQKESLEYQITIRKQTDRIRNLEEQIKLISLVKLYWWFIIFCISIGVFLKVLSDKMQEII
ncbi:MAG: hypothetical protein ABI549_13160 [Flavobacterium sp.]|uniref:hypothetical protein n=1 Tax=Flavobacterium sp. TaxID=239 RepID=UPI003265B6A7